RQAPQSVPALRRLFGARHRVEQPQARRGVPRVERPPGGGARRGAAAADVRAVERGAGRGSGGRGDPRARDGDGGAGEAGGDGGARARGHRKEGDPPVAAGAGGGIGGARRGGAPDPRLARQRQPRLPGDRLDRGRQQDGGAGRRGEERHHQQLHQHDSRRRPRARGRRRRLLRAREHVRAQLRPAGRRPTSGPGEHRRALLLHQHPQGRPLDVHRRRPRGRGGVRRCAHPSARGLAAGRGAAEARQGGGQGRSGDGGARARIGDRVHRRGDPAGAQLLLDGGDRRAPRRRLLKRRQRPDAGAHDGAQPAARLPGRGRGSVSPREPREPGRSGAGRRPRARARRGRRARHAPSGGQMIRINLLPAEEAQAAAGRRQELFTGVLAVLSVVLIMTLAHMWQWVRLAEATRELNRLTQELVALQGPYATVQKIEAQKRELREKLKVIGELETKRRGPVRALEDLSSATPDKLWLTEFADTGGTLKISGLGVDEQTVADFMRRLAASPYFRAVDLDQPLRTKVTMLVVLLVCGTALDWTFVYSPRAARLAELQSQVLERRTELDTKRTKANSREALEREVRDLSAELKRAQAQLPDQREIADLLSSIAASGRQSGLDITLFRQKPEVYHDFYADVPVQMEMRGTFHDVVAFLDRVKRLDRIVNISDIHLAKPRVDGDRVLLDASCTATTFRFLDEAERARLSEQKKKAGNKPNAGKGT